MSRILFCVFFVLFSIAFSQERDHIWNIDVNYFKGNIALHNKDILHLIKKHPEGVLLSWNKKTYGFNAWEQRYNYPDYGVSFIYQNFKNDVLGNNYALYAHYNFYFLKRHLMFRIGQGLAYNTHPYDKQENYKNIVFGSKFLGSAYFMLNYKKERIIDRYGLQVGLFFVHYSNASMKSPNSGTNSIAFNIGVTYNLDEKGAVYKYTIDKNADRTFSEPIKYNLVLRGGLNESDLIGSGQYAMYAVSAYADKRISKKSAFQLGTDVFFSNFLKEYIKYKSVAFPEEGTTGDEDYKRIGAFAGYELFVNKMSVEAQLGYYVYYPFDFEGRVYTRIGLKHYFYKHWFGAITLKSHGAKAEGVEFGVGVRL